MMFAYSQNPKWLRQVLSTATILGFIYALLKKRIISRTCSKN